jgi:predicted nucleotidyltransferase
VRLSKDQLVEGIPAQQARELMRIYRVNPGLTEFAVDLLEVGDAEAEKLLERFVEAGYLEIAERDRNGVAWWFTTIRGNALANASFAKPITRATAQRHLDGFLERVRTYNADRSKPYSVTRVTVFGSYLDSTRDRLGDLDLAIQVVRRGSTEEYLKRRDAITAASSRHFGSYFERLVWPLRELGLYLKDRKPAINITDEDVSALTDQWSNVYDIRADESAEQPPENATVEGLS